MSTSEKLVPHTLASSLYLSTDNVTSAFVELAAFVVEVGLDVVLADDLVEKLGREVKSVLRVAQQLLGLFVVTMGKQRSG